MIGVLDDAATHAISLEDAVLTVEFSCSGSLCVLTMVGKLVAVSICALEVQIDQIGCSPARDVVLDVTRLTVIDTVGTRVLVGLDTYVRAMGGELRISGARGQVAQALTPTPLVVHDARSVEHSRLPRQR